ncbi:hypothetical protein [Pseudomonas asplenii]|uniref:Uncharacterized protein n=1 Tax=Pseudomonas asplenii TaxID=53407 RepID=A0A1H6NXN6_9PSED|nr:hypothetical protein [Pseudomonas fuscovaginae]SEI21782.1 hypothetical protein SAMN05216581_4620 [Pseudomonas fuscovaginae]
MKKKFSPFDGVVWGKIRNLISRVLQLSGLVGLISLSDDLKAWKALWDNSIAWVGTINLDVAAVLSKIPQGIHSVAVVWRGTLHPLIDFLTGWLPFVVPNTLKDIILLGVFLAVGRKRARKTWSKSYRVKQGRINIIMGKYLKVSVSEFISYSKNDARDFLLAKTGDPEIITSHHKRLLERFHEHFGEDAEEFAYAVLGDAEVMIAEEGQLPALNISDKERLVTHCLAGSVAVLLLIDYIYFSSNC